MNCVGGWGWGGAGGGVAAGVVLGGGVAAGGGAAVWGGWPGWGRCCHWGRCCWAGRVAWVAAAVRAVGIRWAPVVAGMAGAWSARRAPRHSWQGIPTGPRQPRTRRGAPPAMARPHPNRPRPAIVPARHGKASAAPRRHGEATHRADPPRPIGPGPRSPLPGTAKPPPRRPRHRPPAPVRGGPRPPWQRSHRTAPTAPPPTATAPPPATNPSPTQPLPPQPLPPRPPHPPLPPRVKPACLPAEGALPVARLSAWSLSTPRIPHPAGSVP